MKRETQEKKFRLPKEFAEKWIAALRSGEYKQGEGSLFDGDSYCCLGVGCVVSGMRPKTIEMGSIIQRKYRKPPKEIRGDSEENRLVAHLIDMNDGNNSDGTHYTFPQIADWIEQNVELY